MDVSEECSQSFEADSGFMPCVFFCFFRKTWKIKEAVCFPRMILSRFDVPGRWRPCNTYALVQSKPFVLRKAPNICLFGVRSGDSLSQGIPNLYKEGWGEIISFNPP